MLRRLPALALVLLVAALETFRLYANDVWMHLLLGRDILRTGIPHREVYSYTAAGRPFVYHEWLAGVLFRALEIAGGPALLLILQPLAALAIAWLAYRTCRSLGADPDLSVAAIGLGLYVASFRLFVRPHLLALPLLAATLWLLERYRRRGGIGPLVALLAVQVVWTNLHGSFPEGPVLAALFAAGEAVRRRLRPTEGSPAPLLPMLALAPAMLLVSLLNPYGLELVRLTLLHPVDPMFRERIYEYFPTFGAAFRDTRMFGLFLGWLALVAGAAWLGRRRSDPALLLPVAAFGALAIWMNRGIPHFVIVSIPWVAAGFSAGFPAREAGRRTRPLAVAGLLAALALWTVAFGYRFDAANVRRLGWGIDPFTPVRSADYLQATGLGGNVFASFPHGSYLAYRLSPRIRIAFDSRTIPYGEAVYREYLAARSGLEGFRKHLERYRVDVVHLAFRLDGDPAIHDYLMAAPDWALVHVDDEVVVYARRTPETAAVLDRDRLECLHPVRFDHGGIPPELAGCWEADARRLLERDPDGVLVRFLLAAALQARGRFAEALEATESLVGRPDAPSWVFRLRAALLTELGDRDGARRARAAADRLEAVGR